MTSPQAGAPTNPVPTFSSFCGFKESSRKSIHCLPTAITKCNQENRRNCIEFADISRIIEMVNDFLIVFSPDNVLDLDCGSCFWECGGFPNEMSNEYC